MQTALQAARHGLQSSACDRVSNLLLIGMVLPIRTRSEMLNFQAFQAILDLKNDGGIYLKDRESLIKWAFPVFFVSNLLLVQSIFVWNLFQKGYSFPQLIQGLVVVDTVSCVS